MSNLTTALEKAAAPTWISLPAGISQWAKRAAEQPGWIKLGALSLLTIIVGWLDYVTGWEVSLSVVYAIAVLLAVWLVGRDGALFMALLAGLVCWLANVTENPYHTLWGYNWALFSRLIYLVFVAIGGSALRTKQKADAAQIRMLKEMRQLEKVIVSITEHEQQRIGQDLHDGLCQELAAIGCATRALADDLQARGMAEAADAEKIEEAIQHTVIEARSLARGIFPVHVDRSGLSAALTELACRTQRLTGIPIELAESADVHVDDLEVAMHLYRIAQEAVANAVRHSGARHVVITLEATRNRLELRVDDDGIGLEASPHNDPHGLGLRTMRYRAQSIGAHFSIQPRPGGGTSVVCQLRVKTNL